MTTPLFKGEDSCGVNNYCPISIAKLIFNQLSLFINSLNILSPLQSGFRPNFFTTTPLFKFTNYVFSSFDNGQATCAIFIDHFKGFRYGQSLSSS